MNALTNLEIDSSLSILHTIYDTSCAHSARSESEMDSIFGIVGLKNIPVAGLL